MTRRVPFRRPRAATAQLPRLYAELRGHPAARVLARALVTLLLTAVVAAPLAASLAITHASVQDTIGVSPTTFSIGTRGHSELRLGFVGTVYLHQSRGPFGLIATVNGPTTPDTQGVGSADLASYVRPQMLQLYAGLFHDPGQAVDGYVDLLMDEVVHEFLVLELILSVVGAGALLAVSTLVPRRRRLPHRRARIVGSWGAALVISTGLAGWQLTWPDEHRPDAGVYALPALTGSRADGSTTNSPVLRLLLGGAIPKVKTLVQRQERHAADFRQRALADLDRQQDFVSGPEPGETAVLMQSDMHCNQSMIGLQRAVREKLNDRFGAEVPSLMAITGDLTTNGTAAEQSCIRNEARIAGDAGIAAVTGNHESDLSSRQMSDAGMTVLDGSTTTVGGVRVLGDGDPERTELFGGTSLRGDENEADVGSRLFETATDQKPDLVLVHEAYAAQAFLGVEDMNTFLDGRSSATEPVEDDIRDLPASAVFYGHWHRSVEPRVVWNSDGTWTLVMELDTSGGAVDTPTIGHFSTPWTSPQQEASFPVLFLDDDSRLVTGYQIYSFDTTGRLTVHPRVAVGTGATSDLQASRRVTTR